MKGSFTCKSRSRRERMYQTVCSKCLKLLNVRLDGLFCRRHRGFKLPMFKYCCWRNSDFLRPQFRHCPSNRPQNFKAVNWEHPIYLAVVFFVPQESMKSLTDQEGKRLQTLVEETIKEQKESNKVRHFHFP